MRNASGVNNRQFDPNGTRWMGMFLVNLGLTQVLCQAVCIPIWTQVIVGSMNTGYIHSVDDFVDDLV